MNIYLIRTNSEGKELWSKHFGGSKYDHGNSVQQTDDGGFFITGSTKSFGSVKGDMYLIRTNGDGEKLWSKICSGTESEFAVGESGQQTIDGGFIVAGYKSKKYSRTGYIYLLRLDPKGKKMWEKTFGEFDSGYGGSVLQTISGGFVVAGHTQSFGAGGRDFYVIRTDASGDVH